jgi:hypothetical protein
LPWPSSRPPLAEAACELLGLLDLLFAMAFFQASAQET